MVTLKLCKERDMFLLHAYLWRNILTATHIWPLKLFRDSNKAVFFKGQPGCVWGQYLNHLYCRSLSHYTSRWSYTCYWAPGEEAENKNVRLQQKQTENVKKKEIRMVNRTLKIIKNRANNHFYIIVMQLRHKFLF